MTEEGRDGSSSTTHVYFLIFKMIPFFPQIKGTPGFGIALYENELKSSIVE